MDCIYAACSLSPRLHLINNFSSNVELAADMARDLAVKHGIRVALVASCFDGTDTVLDIFHPTLTGHFNPYFVANLSHYNALLN